jgi:mannosyltransferase OCH1-like enzyme
VPTFATADRIPLLLHQTFRTRELNPELKASVQAMRQGNPGWEYRFYDDADIRDYILNAYGEEFLNYFQALNPKYAAARADLFRYLLMYREGGVYLDIKSHATKPLSEVIRPTDRFLISQWRDGPDNAVAMWGVHAELKHVEGGEFQQWFIAAVPGHPFLKATIEAVLHNIRRYHPLTHSIGKPAVLRTTGPIAYTRAIHPLRDRHPYRLVDSETDLGFRYSIFPKQDHQAALGRHYAEVGESLVGGDPLSRASAFARRSFKRLRRTLRNR